MKHDVTTVRAHPRRTADLRHSAPRPPRHTWTAASWVSLWRCVVISLPLVVADVAALGIPAIVAGWLTTSLQLEFPAVTLGFVVCGVFTNGLWGLYPAIGMHPSHEMRQSVCSTVCTATALAAGIVLGGFPAAVGALVMGSIGLAAAVLQPLLRSLARSGAAQCSWWGQPAVLFGDATRARHAFGELERLRCRGLRPVGIVALQDDDADPPRAAGWHATWSGECDDSSTEATGQQLAAFQSRFPGCWSIVLEDRHGRERTCERMGDIDFAHGMPVRLLATVGFDTHQASSRRNLEIGWLSGIAQPNGLLSPSQLMLKRSMDIGLTVVSGIVTLPAILLIAGLIKVTSRGPILYITTRIGKHGRHIVTWKFRTMVVDADQVLARYLQQHPELRDEWESTQKLRRDPRVTRLGRILRQTSLDELPQLFNVLRGDMSLVGPRPIVDDEVAKYGDRFHEFCQVKPGLTGLWQVSGRNNTSYEERVALDRYYARIWSPWLDLYILARTLVILVTREGAY